jgi:hypothetical protein
VIVLGLDLLARLTSAAMNELFLVRRLIDITSLGPSQDRRSIDSPSTPRLCSREAYNMLSPPCPRDASVCVAWSLRLPSKLKIFAYLADIDHLSTRANLFYKNCAPSDICVACSAMEIGRHLLSVVS